MQTECTRPRWMLQATPNQYEALSCQLQLSFPIQQFGAGECCFAANSASLALLVRTCACWIAGDLKGTTPGKTRADPQRFARAGLEGRRLGLRPGVLANRFHVNKREASCDVLMWWSTRGRKGMKWKCRSGKLQASSHTSGFFRLQRGVVGEDEHRVLRANDSSHKSKHKDLQEELNQVHVPRIHAYQPFLNLWRCYSLRRKLRKPTNVCRVCLHCCRMHQASIEIALIRANKEACRLGQRCLSTLLQVMASPSSWRLMTQRPHL